MQARLLFSLLLSSTIVFACDSGGDDGDGTSSLDSGGADSSASDTGTPDAGGDADMGVSSVECDPLFGAAGACGGDLSGVFNYRAACGRTPVGTVIETQCPAVDLRADRFNGGNGTLTINGTSLSLAVAVQVHVEAVLPAACTIGGCVGTQLALTQAFPQATTVCTAAAPGCDCTVDGPVNVRSNGTVTTGGGVATVDGQETYYYCVEGGSLTYRRFGTGDDEGVYVLDR